MSFAGMLMRSRARQAASAMRLSSSPSSSLDKQQLDVRRIGLAVAREAVAAERERERRKARIVRRVGKTVDAGRQQSRQLARPERIAPCRALVLQAEQHAVDAALGGRQQQALARLGLEGGGLDELSRRRTERLGDAAERRFRDEGDGRRRVSRPGRRRLDACCFLHSMRSFAPRRPRARGAVPLASINQTLGLTVYCSCVRRPLA